MAPNIDQLEKFLPLWLHWLHRLHQWHLLPRALAALGAHASARLL